MVSRNYSQFPTATAPDGTEYILLWQNNANVKLAISGLPGGVIPSKQVSASTYAPTTADTGYIIEFSNNCTVTIPTHATQAFADDAQFAVVGFGGAVVTVQAASGVTFIAPNGTATLADGSEMWLRKRKESVVSNTWVLQQ